MKGKDRFAIELKDSIDGYHGCYIFIWIYSMDAIV